MPFITPGWMQADARVFLAQALHFGERSLAWDGWCRRRQRSLSSTASPPDRLVSYHHGPPRGQYTRSLTDLLVSVVTPDELDPYQFLTSTAERHDQARTEASCEVALDRRKRDHMDAYVLSRIIVNHARSVGNLALIKHTALTNYR